jgi:bile acid-coenzyme A ligase
VTAVRRSISRILTWHAERDPDRVVVRAPDATLTARELDELSTRLARAYQERGVRRDDLVSVVLPNSAELVVACAAVWKAGATPNLLPPDLDPVERAEIEELVAPSLVVGAAPTPPGVPGIPAGFAPGDELSGDPLPDLWASSWKAPISSGSTGRPKLVLARAPALLDPTRQVAPFLPVDGVQLVSGPLHHSAVFTYAFRGLMTGHELVILPRFEERAVLRAVEQRRVTWALLVPTMIHRLLRLPAAERAAADWASLETVLHMGAPIAAEDKRALMDWVGPERVVEVYAGSESNGLTMIRGDEWLAHPGSVGRPIGGTSLRILRADGSDADAGEPGLVWMHRAGEPTYAYRGATSARTPDGWDTLGDRGFLDADGYLTVLDREDDLILRGGVNVYPVVVEHALESHPAVRSAVAYGVPDPDLGQRIEAVVDVGDAPDDVLDDVARHAAGRLGPERRIAALRRAAGPLRNDAGKVRRSAYRDTGPRSAAPGPSTTSARSLMRKIILFMSVSLDGFIEGPNREIDWHMVDDELHRHFNEQLRAMGAFLSGRVTHELMAEFWPTADEDPASTAPMVEFAGIWRDMPKIVYSRTLERAGWNTTVVRDVVVEEIRALTAQPGGDLSLGGADLAATFMAHDLIDEYRIYVHPVLIGRGKPLFRPSDKRVNLRLVEARTFGNGVVLLRYGRPEASSAELDAPRDAHSRPARDVSPAS